MQVRQSMRGLKDDIYVSSSYVLCCFLSSPSVFWRPSTSRCSRVLTERTEREEQKERKKEKNGEAFKRQEGKGREGKEDALRQKGHASLSLLLPPVPLLKFLGQTKKTKKHPSLPPSSLHE